MEILLTTDLAARIWLLLHSIGFELVLLMLKAFVLMLACHWSISQLQRSSAEIRHLSWLCFFLSLALLPLIGDFLPIIELTVSAYHPLSIREQLQQLANLQAAMPIESSNTPAVPDYLRSNTQQTNDLSVDQYAYSIFVCLALAYLTVVSIKLYHFYNALQQLRGLKRRAQLHFALRISNSNNEKTSGPSGQSIKVYVSDEIDSAITWGFLNPCILLPQHAHHWDQKTVRSVLAHELAHIQRKDWLTLSFTKLISILFFPLPGLHNAFIQCNLEAESSADNQAITECSSTIAYAQALLELAKKTTLDINSNNQEIVAGKKIVLTQAIHNISLDYAVGICGQSEFSTRIIRIIEPIAIREKTASRHKLAAIVFTLCFVAPLAAIHPVAKSNLERHSTLTVEFAKDIKPQILDSNNQKTATTLENSFVSADSDTDILSKRTPVPIFPSKHSSPIDHGAISINTQDILIDKTATVSDMFDQFDTQVKLATKTLAYRYQKLNSGGKPTLTTTTLAKQAYPSAIASLNIIPKYPKRALLKNIEGEVRATYIVDQNGKAKDIEIILSKPNSVFNKAVVDAIRRSVFEPTKKHSLHSAKQQASERFEQTYLFRLTDIKTNVAQRNRTDRSLGFNAINSS